jgi:hypothetical protein
VTFLCALCPLSSQDERYGRSIAEDLGTRNPFSFLHGFETSPLEMTFETAD